MFGIDNTGSALDTVAHIIQVALTPVFLLSGIATLLNVFSTRLARVADRVDAVSRALESADPDQAKVLAIQPGRRSWFWADLLNVTTTRKCSSKSSDSLSPGAIRHYIEPRSSIIGSVQTAANPQATPSIAISTRISKRQRFRSTG
jgi:hypothetical protein